MGINVFKNISWESVSVFLLCSLVFLLPIFTLPLMAVSFMLGKALLVYLLISLMVFFWALGVLQKNQIIIPKSTLFLSAIAIVFVWFLSSLFSGNQQISFVGKGDEVGTLLFFLLLASSMFLSSVFLNTEKRAMTFYSLIFGSGLVVFLFQLLHMVFKINIIPFDVFPYTTSNLIGGWNDFFIFFGFIGLTALIFFEHQIFEKKLKILFVVSLFLSFLSMLAVNFMTGWIVFGSFVLIFLIYLISQAFFKKGKNEQNQMLLKLSFFVLLAVFLVILIKEIGMFVTTSLDSAMIDVRPSWVATFDIVKNVFKDDFILGSGPNTFLYDWFKFKSLAVNNTAFWNVRFASGIGHLLSMVATTGVLGTLALLSFLAVFFSYTSKVLSYNKSDLKQAFLVSSFFGSAYLWVFVVFYSPGFVIFSMAFLVTGLFLATLAQAGKIKTTEISLVSSPKIGFISVMIIVLVIIGSVSSLYLFIQKARASFFYNNAIQVFNKEGDLQKTEGLLAKAIAVDDQDEYFRAMSELNLTQLQQIFNNGNLPPEEARLKFQNILSYAIQNAQQATKVNGNDPLNWMQLGRVYEMVVPLKITGADGAATAAYQEALKNSPTDPSPFLAMARVEIQNNKLKEAREYLQSALRTKGDFTDALFLLSKIDVQEGNIQDAIVKTEQAAFLSPNDASVLFQLGMLYYQVGNWDSSRTIFERAVSLNENYANARYFLGLIYDRQGERAKALEQFRSIAKTNPGNQEVQEIINNLENGEGALDGISPPGRSPEQRDNPPITEEETSLKKKK